MTGVIQQKNNLYWGWLRVYDTGFPLLKDIKGTKPYHVIMC